MPKYKVTGGADGVSGVEVDGQRHEPGDTFDSTAKKVGWLVDSGYIVATGKGRTADLEGED